MAKFHFGNMLTLILAKENKMRGHIEGKESERQAGLAITLIQGSYRGKAGQCQVEASVVDTVTR